MNHVEAIPAITRPIWSYPWRFMLVALAANGTAFVWARCAGEDHVPFAIGQAALIVVGLLAAGVAIWSRCASPHEAVSFNQLPETPRRRALFALAALHVALASAATAWVLLKLEGRSDLPGDIVGTLFLWLLVVPWCAYAAYQLALLARQPALPQKDGRFETAVLVTQAGLVALLASWALYWSADAAIGDSLRLFLAAMAAFAFLAAPLIAANPTIRRLGVSVLIVYHFAGILSAVISAQPGPWIVGQAQHWVFRPYLGFMYLANAYRFYAPEPGPASQLWCRIEYLDGNKPLSHWVKVPDMDDEGRPSYRTSLQYTRRLALTENVARTTPAPTMTLNAKGEMEIATYVKRRDQNSTNPQFANLLGEKQTASPLKVPMHPDSAVNYQRPAPEGQVLLSSFARYLLHRPHPEHPDAKPVAVKIYRVQHQILPAAALAVGADPRDWIYYFPYYVGKFDTDGKLLDPEDPFLYWLLPMVRENAIDPQSRLKCYVFLHAGDETQWIRDKPNKW